MSLWTRAVGLVALSFFLIAQPVPAIAQGTPKMEVSAGYQWLDGGKQEAFSGGWYADAAYNWNKWGARTRWFAQLLLGGTRVSANGTAASGTDRGGVRVAADRVSTFHDGDVTNMYKFTTGVVLPFGRH